MNGQMADAKCLSHSGYSASYAYGCGSRSSVLLWFSLVRYFVGIFVFAFLKAELRATDNIFLYILKSCFLGAGGGVKFRLFRRSLNCSARAGISLGLARY